MLAQLGVVTVMVVLFLTSNGGEFQSLMVWQNYRCLSPLGSNGGQMEVRVHFWYYSGALNVFNFWCYNGVLNVCVANWNK